jgi:hypothetical protein
MKWGKLIKKIHFWDLPAESAILTNKMQIPTSDKQ